ncbi:MAG: TonB-dependent receptor [Porticoccaceae bacterium]|nr:TonB-dependent receptor [Porticoccaceae bacterium]
MINVKKQALCGAVVAGLASLVAVDVLAASSFALEEIVVTAQKRSESAQDVGMSITALSGDSLKASGVVTTSDLGKVVPGFVYTKTPRGTPTYALRGIGFDDNSLASAPTVSTYLDEIPMAYPVMTRFAAFDLAQVEVLKGPQGILFGQNSTGGAINFISQKPSDEFEAGIEASYGKFNTFETQGYISGALSDTFRIRASGMSIQSDEGWQKSITRDDELGEQDVFSGRLIADWTPTENLGVVLTLQGWVDKSDTQAAQLLETHHSIDPTAVAAYDAYPRAANNAESADWDANPVRPLERDDQFFQPSLRIDYSLSDAITLTSITAYSDYEQDFNQDTDGANLQNFSLTNIGSIESLSQELRLTGDHGDLKWILGVNYTEDETVDDTYYYFANNSVNGALGIAEAFSSADQDMETRAVFGNVAWSFTDALTLNIGARYTEDERTYAGCTGDTGDGTMAAAFDGLWQAVFGVVNNIQPGGCTTGTNGVAGLVHRELDEDNVSWRLGLDWQVNENLLSYANVSKGYKSGSIPAVNSSTSAQIEPVTQESVLAYEVGFKSTLLDDRMRLNGAAFYYDYEDKQLRGRILDFVFGPLEALVNIPESEVYGAEIGMDLVPVEGLTLSLNASYTETEVTDEFLNYDPLANGIDYNGLSFPHTPELHITANVNYEREITDAVIGFAGFSVLHQDETTGLFNDPAVLAASPISPFRPGVNADPNTFDVDSYTTVDARFGIESVDGTWKTWIWGRNIFDEYYWNNATQSLDSFYRLSSMPRTYGIAASYQF